MTEEQGGICKEYNLEHIPDYRKPVVEELILMADLLVDDYDTPENLDNLAIRIFDVIIEQHLLDAHLREQIQPGSHD
jgi:hypothetical protein